jgi:hypothetical protein
MPDWPGYVVRMIRDVLVGFLGVGDGGVFCAKCESRIDVEGGDDDIPLAGFGRLSGSKLGESLRLPRD